jgi:hypothetical protein
MDQGGRIVDVEILNGDDPSIVNAFREVIGLDISNADQCATAAGVATGEILQAINVNPRLEAKP